MTREIELPCAQCDRLRREIVRLQHNARAIARQATQDAQAHETRTHDATRTILDPPCTHQH